MKIKKIAISVATLGMVAAAVIGATMAFYSDTETSTDNIFVAGSIDLKVDHVWQTYNGVDCRTCDVTLISDTTNMVVAKNDNPIESPYNAVYVSSIHPRWTAQNDSQLADAGAEWIWEHDPTREEDTTQDVTYTFQKKFEWWGPIVGSDLWFAVGSDNSVEVYLNEIKIGENTGEYGYQEEHMLHIDGADVTNNIIQGTNVLEFKVKNWGQEDGTPENNPAGLIYKFSIDGSCEGDYFKSHCQLWAEKDLEQGDRFFDFEDIKPGDWGTNIISLHAYDNDAWGCLIAHNREDEENKLMEPEIEMGDDDEDGELSNYLTVMVWHDKNENNEPDSEEDLSEPVLISELGNIGIFDSTNDKVLPSCETQYVGLAWCAGDMEWSEETGFSCDGSAMENDAQSDSFSADLTAYAEQWRNNTDFECSSELPTSKPQ